jgi:hypothetical protein
VKLDEWKLDSPSCDIIASTSLPTNKVVASSLVIDENSFLSIE